MKQNESMPPTPSPEEKWRASVYAPEKMQRRIRLLYYLLAGWSVLAAAWIVGMWLAKEFSGGHGSFACGSQRSSAGGAP